MESASTNCILTAKDFVSNQQVKWCPGCGDYAVLNAVQKTLVDLQIPKENAVFVSGIGCSSRFPYYMATYGFHTIHGRAAAIASGLKLANPALSVWVISGDGDSLAIGGNHFIHVIRRNLDLNLILFNNEIYGLTKGQSSPTTKKGQVTKSAPHGTIENPFIPGELALGAGSDFYARVPDSNVKLMTQVMLEAEKHRGFSLVEVLQNCVIFNDDVHAAITGKDTKADNQLILEQGKPMLFGKEMNKGIRLNGLKLEVVTIGENDISEKDILIHDAYAADPTLHSMLVRMKLPDFPVAMGIIRNTTSEVYNDLFHDQIENERKKSEFNSLDDLFHSGNVFHVN